MRLSLKNEIVMASASLREETMDDDDSRRGPEINATCRIGSDESDLGF